MSDAPQQKYVLMQRMHATHTNQQAFRLNTIDYFAYFDCFDYFDYFDWVHSSAHNLGTMSKLMPAF